MASISGFIDTSMSYPLRTKHRVEIGILDTFAPSAHPIAPSLFAFLATYSIPVPFLSG